MNFTYDNLVLLWNDIIFHSTVSYTTAEAVNIGAALKLLNVNLRGNKAFGLTDAQIERVLNHRINETTISKYAWEYVHSLPYGHRVMDTTLALALYNTQEYAFDGEHLCYEEHIPALRLLGLTKDTPLLNRKDVVYRAGFLKLLKYYNKYGSKSYEVFVKCDLKYGEQIAMKLGFLSDTERENLLSLLSTAIKLPTLDIVDKLIATIDKLPKLLLVDDQLEVDYDLTTKYGYDDFIEWDIDISNESPDACARKIRKIIGTQELLLMQDIDVISLFKSHQEQIMWMLLTRPLTQEQEEYLIAHSGSNDYYTYYKTHLWQCQNQFIGGSSND